MGGFRKSFVVGAVLALAATVLVLAGPGAVRPAAAQSSCAATSQATLAACITAYNNETAAVTHAVTFSADITLAAALPAIDNSAGATLDLSGGGFGLDTGPGFPASANVLVQVNGDLELSDLSVSGATFAGLEVSGGDATVADSTFHSNGTGMFAASTGVVEIINSTVFDNTVDGIVVGIGKTVTVRQSTVVDNGRFGIEDSSAASVLIGSLVAGNNAGGTSAECNGGDHTGSSNSVIDDASCGGIDETVGAAGSYATTLADNGCAAPCAPTIALLPGSAAVDAAGNCAPVTTDQRGEPRTVGKCDAGAFELGDCASTADVATETELAVLIGCYNNAGAGDTVTADFTADITLAAGLPWIENSTSATLELNGGGFTLDTGAGFPAGTDIVLQLEGDLALSDLTVTGGTNFGLHLDGGDATVVGSTFHGNEFGIGANSPGVVKISNSTVFGNTFSGISVSGATVTVRQSTVVDNGSYGIDDSGAASVIIGSLVAGNNGGGTGAECNSGDHTGSSNSVIDDASCGGITATPGVGGTSADTLAANGCTAPCTPTIALLPGSPAVDAAADCAPLTTDQRGELRTAGKCDAGAFELADCATTADVATETELAVVIGCYNNAASGETVTANFTADITLADELPEINNTNGAKFVLNGMGFTLGTAPGFPGGSDVLWQLDGDLELHNLTVTGATDDGLQVRGGDATVNASTFYGNEYGIFATSSGVVEIVNSTIFGNTLFGIAVGGGDTVTVRQSTVVDNGDFGIEDGSAASVIIGSLVAGNNGDGTGGECNNGDHTGSSGSVIDDASCAGIAATAGVVGTYANALAGNGCTAPCTPTIALMPGSPALDAAADCTPVTTDQRGVARTTGNCDAGAFELGDADVDGDGFEGTLGDGTDCDDTESGVNPGAAEIADDGIDQDCDGADLITAVCNGLAVTINMNTNGGNGVGTAGDDVILGTPGDDLISGLGGDDTICAGDGDDQALGGDGDDTILGEGGRDILRGNPGADIMSGGDGNDRVLGGIGNDFMNGNAGNDYLGGFGGADVINGGPGNETIFGGFGGDTINGGDGNDEIFGLIGDDIINGGPGDDELNGDRGNDTINGGPGNDTIRGGNANDTLNGDAGDDSVSGGKADDALSGGDDIDVCIGNLETTADTADATCETQFGIP